VADDDGQSRVHRFDPTPPGFPQSFKHIEPQHMKNGPLEINPKLARFVVLRKLQPIVESCEDVGTEPTVDASSVKDRLYTPI
jgi:hypothetical protein